MDLYLCDGSYNFLACLDILEQKNEEADIIFTDADWVTSIDLQYLRESKMFREIYVISPWAQARRFRNSKIMRLLLYLKLIYWDNLYEMFPLNKYETVYCSESNFCNLCLYSFYKRFGAHLEMYEDGIRTYRFHEWDSDFMHRYMQKILFNYDGAPNECKRLWVRNTKQLLKINELKMEIKIIENSGANKIEEVEKIFKTPLSDIQLFHSRFLFFDQNFSSFHINQTQRCIISEISHIVQHDDFLIKMHPSSKEPYQGDYQVINNKIPFEIILACIPWPTRQVLVSVCSTSCFSPKMIYDREMTVIFTYKIMKEMGLFGKETARKIEAEVMKLREVYQKKDLVYTPSSLQEMKDIVKRLYNNG